MNYVEHAWMATNNDGLAALLYAAGELTARAGATGGAVTLVTETRYPFGEVVNIAVKQSPAGGFPLYLRIPEWADGATVRVNNKDLNVAPKPGAYVLIVNDWKAGDQVRLRLPMRIHIRTWKKNRDSVSVNYGPLTFSLRIEEKYSAVPSDKTAINDSRWQASADAGKWPSFEILPRSAWNYALLLDKSNPADSFEVVRKPWPANDQPFTNADAPIELRANGRRVPRRTLDRHGLAGALPRSPVETDEPVKRLTLVPMGGARLRISSFPVAAPRRPDSGG